MRSRTYLGLFVTALCLCLCSSAKTTGATDACREMTAAGLSASTWTKTVNGTYRPLNKVKPSTTQTWGAANIVGLDNVNLKVVKSYKGLIDYVYTLMPITHNRNAANIEHKYIMVRMTSTSNDVKAEKSLRYFDVHDLFGCNVHISQSAPIDWHSIKWDYYVLSV